MLQEHGEFVTEFYQQHKDSLGGVYGPSKNVFLCSPDSVSFAIFFIKTRFYWEVSLSSFGKKSPFMAQKVCHIS